MRTFVLKMLYVYNRKRVAVGMPVTRHPPHRSQHALLTHWAPALGYDAKACCLAYPSERALHTNPALCPERVLLRLIPLGQPPFLRRLRHFQRSFVRRLLRYYAVVRLPMSVHHCITSLDFSMRPPATLQLKVSMGSPGSRERCFHTCTRSATAQGPNISRDSDISDVAFRIVPQRRHPEVK